MDFAVERAVLCASSESLRAVVKTSITAGVEK